MLWSGLRPWLPLMVWELVHAFRFSPVSPWGSVGFCAGGGTLRWRGLLLLPYYLESSDFPLPDRRSLVTPVPSCRFYFRLVFVEPERVRPSTPGTVQTHVFFRFVPSSRECPALNCICHWIVRLRLLFY